jgi:hypothetical protein
MRHKGAHPEKLLASHVEFRRRTPFKGPASSSAVSSLIALTLRLHSSTTRSADIGILNPPSLPLPA